MKKPELLSPAGNLTKLKIALEYGADAVYASVGSFSLRARSGKEFDLESFSEGVRYTHSKGAKFYATLNAFAFNGQIEPLKRHIKAMAEMGVDAFIIASAGIMSLAKELAPNIQIHLSTQANVMNYLDAKVYMDMGARRIVMARELSLKDVVLIKEKLPELEIEIFCHGSMCFAYSGRCLISAVQNGRSSNRGACANDCRFAYNLYAHNENSGVLFKIEQNEQGTHIFNSKDLNLSAHIEQILKSNAIDSLKIEGRTKSEYYVACATRAYRMAIDDAMSGNFRPELYADELNTLKNRGFSDGYLISRPYEKTDMQNLDTNISEGLAQVECFSQDAKSFLAKGQIYLNKDYEILAPLSAKLKPFKDEIGEIFERDGRFYLHFFKLLSVNGKEFNEIHSGNTNAILLPQNMPAFSFLRSRINK